MFVSSCLVERSGYYSEIGREMEGLLLKLCICLSWLHTIEILKTDLLSIISCTKPFGCMPLIIVR